MSPDDKDAALLPRRIGRILGIDSPADDTARSSRVDFLFSRSAALGKSQAHAGSPPRRLVGCEQDWDVAAAD